MSLPWIPKGNLKKIGKHCSCFIWSDSGEKNIQPWAKWDLIARPKSLGGWGLKNIFLFSKSSAAKKGWRIITNNNHWSNVIYQKYISPGSLEDWIRSPTKSHSISIFWKALISSFPVIVEGLAWKVGRGNHHHIGADPWPGSGMTHILPLDLIILLHGKYVYLLSQLADPQTTTQWTQGWKKSTDLGLLETSTTLYKKYIKALQIGHIRLTDREDELV
jgi:hypothetical protein